MKDLLLPPKAELKLPQVNYKELMYPRLQNKVLEVNQRNLSPTPKVSTVTECDSFGRTE